MLFFFNLFPREKQERLEKIRQKLHAQMLQRLDDEDERIRRANEEHEAKRALEEQVKEEWNKKMQKEMLDHRTMQVSGGGPPQGTRLHWAGWGPRTRVSSGLLVNTLCTLQHDIFNFTYPVNVCTVQYSAVPL